LHDQFDVGNARRPILKYDTKSTLARHGDCFNACNAAASMVDCIAAISLAAVTNLVWSTRLNPTAVDRLRTS